MTIRRPFSSLLSFFPSCSLPFSRQAAAATASCLPLSSSQLSRRQGQRREARDGNALGNELAWPGLPGSSNATVPTASGRRSHASSSELFSPLLSLPGVGTAVPARALRRRVVVEMQRPCALPRPWMEMWKGSASFSPPIPPPVPPLVPLRLPKDASVVGVVSVSDGLGIFFSER